MRPLRAAATRGGPGRVAPLAALACALVVLAACGSGDDEPAPARGPTPPAEGGTGAVPPALARRIRRAARAARCRVVELEPAEVARRHRTVPRSLGNPPVFGLIDERTIADDGAHERTPPLRSWLHALSHGAVAIQYRPGAPARTVAALERLADRPNVLVFPNGTRMRGAVAATAWYHSVTCPRADSDALAVMRLFRDARATRKPRAPRARD